MSSSGKILLTLSLLIVLQSAPSSAQDYGWLAGYKFSSDVSQHSYIDLDQASIENGDVQASMIYKLGKNSMKSDGSLRSLSGFSTSAGSKLENEGFFELYRKYYGFASYADEFVVAAFGGTGELRNKSPAFLMEAKKLGTKVLNVWMYVIHELEASINDCFEYTEAGKSKSVKHWDEGWAFYAGSLEGDDGSGAGVMLYGLAEELCSSFGKCFENGGAPINFDILTLYNDGKGLIMEQKCNDLVEIKIEIVKKMTATLVQGLLYSASQYQESEMDEFHAAGLVYSRGLLPILNNCNKNAADLIVQNFAPNLEAPVSSSLHLIANTMYKELHCMGISCTDIGTFDGLPACMSTGEYKVVAGSDAPSISPPESELDLGESPEPVSN